ncbi:MAG: flavin reductase domain protein FMN-binding protein [Nocardioidaceae bacterium]|nr:flavin reductase domain protein FMN-binding protein [Nocardioidaceae bacterium]
MTDSAERDFELRPGESTPVSTEAELDRALRFRDVMGRFASGITVVTGLDPDGGPVGLTCQAFTSVSLNPPLVLFCPAQTSRAWPVLRASGSFCVNLLAADQVEIAAVMATKGADKFAGLAWTPAPGSGAPVLDGSLGYVDCTIRAVHPGGDHDVVIGLVRDLAAYDGDAPLVFFRGAYGAL